MKNKPHFKNIDLEVYQTLQSYVTLDYPISLKKVGYIWEAEHPDLADCKAEGATQEEALKNLEEVKLVSLYSYVEAGKEIPMPNQSQEIENYSGKVLIRIPKELHFKLMNKAKLDGISLNQEILYLLSQSFERSNIEDYFFKLMKKLDETTQNQSNSEETQSKKLKIQEELFDFVKMFNSYLSKDDSSLSTEELDTLQQTIQALNDKMKKQ